MVYIVKIYLILVFTIEFFRKWWLFNSKILGGAIMGSTGSGSFGNYHVRNKPNGGKDEGNGGTGNGVGGNEINLPEKIENIKLEDVATSEYYQVHEDLPSKASNISLRDTVYQGRLVVETADTHEILGNLPTEYNYLRGAQLIGVIVSSGIKPIPYVVVTLHG